MWMLLGLAYQAALKSVHNSVMDGDLLVWKPFQLDHLHVFMTLACPSYTSTVKIHECLITYFHGYEGSPEIFSI